MISYIARRLFQTIGLLFLLSILLFAQDAFSRASFICEAVAI